MVECWRRDSAGIMKLKYGKEKILLKNDLEKLNEHTRLSFRNAPDIAAWFENQGYDTIVRQNTISAHYKNKCVMFLEWSIKKGSWVPWFAGPPAYTFKDLSNIEAATTSNIKTIDETDQAWDELKKDHTEQNWMQYLGSQCPFYQKANKWGKILDKFENLKKLALKAADMLWDQKQKQAGWLTSGAEKQDLLELNQQIYDLLAETGYPEKKK